MDLKRNSAQALEKSHNLLKNADRVLLLLTKIASSAQVLARNRIISRQHIMTNAKESADTYTLVGDLPANVKVVRRGNDYSQNVSNFRLYDL